MSVSTAATALAAQPDGSATHFPTTNRNARGPRAQDVLRTTVVRSTAGALTVTVVAVDTAVDIQLAAVMLAGLVWLAVTAGISVRRSWSKGQTQLVASIDLLLLLLIASVTGGADSSACYVLWLAPLAWAMSIDQRAFVALVFVSPLGYLLLWLPDGLDRVPGSGAALATFAGMYTGAVVVSLVMLHLRLQGADHAAEMQRARIALIRELGLVERAEHERTSIRLHDGPLQALISARQDLDEYCDGDPTALDLGITALDEGIVGLRRMIGDLFPADDATVGDRLDELRRRHTERRTFAVDLQLDPEIASDHDDMLVGIVGELVTNAAKHAKASDLRISVAPLNGWVVIEVRDNGVGMDARDRRTTTASDHIGLSSLDRRVRALGGYWRIRSAPGRGTSVRVELPRG